MPADEPRPFTIHIADEVLADLRERLARRRVLPRLGFGPEDPHRRAFVETVVTRWASFDWRAAEARLNALPLVRVVAANGLGVVALHRRSSRHDARPLLLLNGWPGTLLEYLDVVGPLAEPASAGDPAFHVVVPVMPGYPLSDAAADTDLDEDGMAALVVDVMARLGYTRFVAHGDDFGGSVVSRCAWRSPQHVAAIQVTEWLEPGAADVVGPLAPEEAAYLAALAAWREHERGYGHIQATRPATLAAGLHDSPTGLAAWLVEVLLAWSDLAERAPAQAWPVETVLAWLTLWWATGAIGPSLRLYAAPLCPVPDRGDPIRVPTLVVAPRESRPAAPRVWLERVHADLRGSRQRARGGHFDALERPADFVAEVRELAALI